MTFEIFKGFPPNRQSPVAELHFPRDGVVEVPAEVFRQNGELRITLFGREGGVAWEYSLNEWVEAIQRAIDILD